MDSNTITTIGTGLFGLAIVLWIFCVALAYQNAPKRGRRAPTWAILTLIFGPFALFALFLMKPKPVPGRAGHGASRDPRVDLYEVPKKR
jgi:hypothetical protein